ncbi:unnamed protein product [Scytosiphon promiscuus]
MTSPGLQLMKQVYMGNVAGIEKSLRAGADVDGCEELEYLRPLLVAARLDDIEAIKALARAGCDLEVASRIDPPDTDAPWDCMLDPRLAFPEGTKALHAAALGKSLRGVKLLLELGADCNAEDWKGRTPLCPALVCVSKNRKVGTAIVRALLDGGANPARRSGPHGETVLHFALNEDAPVDVINMLVANSPAALNLPDNRGITPLARAAGEGDVGAAACLLSAGATDKEVLSEYGFCSLYAAVQMGKEKVFDLLVDHGIEEAVGLEAIPRALEYAAQFKRVSMLQVLLGLDAKARQEKRARRGSVKYLELLDHAVRYGAWRRGGTEAFQASLATIHILLSAGTDVGGTGDVIGMSLPAHQRDPRKEAAISRMLERAPAFTARSWAWPCQTDADARVLGGDSRTARPSRSRASRSPIRVRVVRPMRGGVVSTRFARYSGK